MDENCLHSSGNKSFDETCVDALKSLHEKLDFGLWMVTRTDGDDWIVLKSRDRDYGVQDGEVYVWMESFCSRMVEGQGPTFAPDSDKIAAYSTAEIGKKLKIQAYMGVPLNRPNGELIGTLCAINPTTVPADWAQHEPYVRKMALEIQEAYQHEYETAISCVSEEASQAKQDDSVKVLLSLDWDSLSAVQEEKARQAGIPLSIVLIKVDSSNRDVPDLTHSLHKILGRSNYLVYRGEGLFAAILINCDAPKLEAYVELIGKCLDSSSIKHFLGYAVPSESHGLGNAYDRAYNKIISNEFRKRAA